MTDIKGLRLETLRELVQAGSARDAVLVARGTKWMCLVRSGMVERPLLTDRGQVRFFGKLETAVRLLRDLGLGRMSLDASSFDEAQLTIDMRSVSTRTAHTASRHA